MSTSRTIPTSDENTAEAGNRNRVTVVVPCFNEEESIPRLRQALFSCEEHLLPTCAVEVVLVDDGSTDGTLMAMRDAFADRSNYRIARHEQNAGITAAIMTGLREAKTELVCSIDSDCTYDPLQMENLLPLMTDDVDLVTASPYHPDGHVVNLAGWRLGLSRLASILYGLLMQLDIHTYTSCFRLYRRSAICNLRLVNQGFTGVPEMLWRVKEAGGVIRECPATLTAREQGQSKMSVFSVSLAHARLFLRIAAGRILSTSKPQSAKHNWVRGRTPTDQRHDSRSPTA